MMKLIFWSDMLQNCFDLVKSLIFNGLSKYIKMPPSWFTTESKNRKQWLILPTLWLRQHEFGITVCPSIHAFLLLLRSTYKICTVAHYVWILWKFALKVTSAPVSSRTRSLFVESSVDNHLTHYNNNIPWCFEEKQGYVFHIHLHLKNTNTVSRDHHFDIDWTHEVKIIWESEWTWVSLQMYILMRDRIRRENNKQAPHPTVSLFIDYNIAFESVIQSSFEFFVSIHLLLVFDCLFFAG